MIRHLWEVPPSAYDEAMKRIERRRENDRDSGIPRRSAGYLAFEAYSAAYDGGEMTWQSLTDGQRAFWEWVAARAAESR